MGARELTIYVANLCLYADLLKVILVSVGVFVFFPIVVVTVHGEVRAGNVCGVVQILGHLQTLVKSVLKACVSVASILACLCGELLPCQASVTYGWAEDPSSDRCWKSMVLLH